MHKSPRVPEVSAALRKNVADLCICRSLQQAARAIGRRFDDALRPLDITNHQFSLLLAISLVDRPSIGALSAELAMDRTTMTANLKPLERRGLVEMAVAHEDRRSRLVALTVEGSQLVSEGYKIWKKIHADETKRVGRANAPKLRRMLLAVTFR
jgi:DNA-binding MarR family transcriptional regulator